MRAMRHLQVISQFALKLCFGAEFNCECGLVISSNQGIEKNILFYHVQHVSISFNRPWFLSKY